ncbi:MAG TPA: LysR substrate-binding domain-containing protein, partial [Steroidobacteraceae bacterium]|nr:LysR substrate-binding domain-containing protein [Steroidobacteraceae bacterium]
MSGKIDLRKLPPLNALKGFEATTRRQSVREAAEELCLTHPAVSHQIQLLEEEFGVALFSREGRSIVSTPEGRLFYGYARRALELLIEGSETIRRARAQRPLRVQTYVTASLRWLAPRIPRFAAAHPDVRLQLSTCAADWEFDESLGDVGLVYCETAPGPSYHWVPLFDYRLFPVCTPQLRARLGARPQPRDLLQLPLMVVYSEPRNWDVWFESADVPYEPDAGVVVDTLALALEFALGGSGVALVNGPFVDDELASGRLVRPVDHETQCPGGWGLICRQELRDQPRIRAFIEFLAG